jgi:response regulator RpfG family c-di-GMP phosphodiesterase
MMRFGAQVDDVTLPPVGRKRRHVLVVEDDPVVTMLVRKVMDRIGHVVEDVPDGRAALRRLTGEPPDIVFLDVMLPGADGLEIVRALRQTPRWERVPVIMLTALDDTNAKVAGLSAGADDYMTKPFHWAELVARAESHLRAKSLQDDLVRANASLASAADMERRLSERLEETRAQVSDLVNKLIDNFDPVLGEHARRTAELVRLAGERFGLTRPEQSAATQGALVMDMGLIGNGQEVTTVGTATDPFTMQQTARKTHPTVGWALLQDVRGMSEVSRIVRSHHERHDGRGFPDRLGGDDVPRGARLVAAASMWLRLAERHGGAEQASEVIRRNVGTALDPAAVTALSDALVRGDERRRPVAQMTPAELRPGMRVARDVRTADGQLLLGVGQTLSESTVTRVKRDYEAGAGPASVTVFDE